MKSQTGKLASLALTMFWAAGLCQAQQSSRQTAQAARASSDMADVASAQEGQATGRALLGVDLRVLKEQMVAFQNLLNRNIQQSFEQPFSLLQDTKGSYLPRFGVAFHLE